MHERVPHQLVRSPSLWRLWQCSILTLGVRSHRYAGVTSRALALSMQSQPISVASTADVEASIARVARTFAANDRGHNKAVVVTPQDSRALIAVVDCVNMASDMACTYFQGPRWVAYAQSSAAFGAGTLRAWRLGAADEVRPNIDTAYVGAHARPGRPLSKRYPARSCVCCACPGSPLTSQSTPLHKAGC